jgi:hypothetical protein
VRSITSAAGRLLLVPDLGGIAELSRENAVKGVPMLFVDRFGVTVPHAPTILTSVDAGTPSSSCRKLSSESSVGVPFFAPLMCHLPSGSMVTCSVDVDVCCKISRTYLEIVRHALNVEKGEKLSLINCQLRERSMSVAYRTEPLRALFLELQVGGGVKALNVTATEAPTWEHKPHI